MFCVQSRLDSLTAAKVGDDLSLARRKLIVYGSRKLRTEINSLCSGHSNKTSIVGRINNIGDAKNSLYSNIFQAVERSLYTIDNVLIKSATV